MRLWFNHWFSTAYRFMELLLDDFGQDNVVIIGTNNSPYAVYQDKCAEFYEEPVIEDSYKYILWCLSFCVEHKIDVFLPRHNRLVICKYLNLFTEKGIKVLVDSNYDLMLMLEDKYSTAEYFKKNNLCKVPKILKVNNLRDFDYAYQEMLKIYPNERICIKYNKDEGATSFRVIDNTNYGIDALKKGTGSKISLDKLRGLLNTVEKFDDLLLMPYLEGPEVSIDSLMTSKGFISVSRSKMGSRGTLVEYNQEFNKISEDFAKKSGLTMPYNLQLRKHENEYYLLEVNTRMAGGTYKSSEIGVNFPYLAISDLLGLSFDLPILSDKESVFVSQIETAVVLNI